MMKPYNNMKKINWLGTIIITLIIGIVFGYTWGKGSSSTDYDRGYMEGIEESVVLVKGEICQ